MRLSLEVRESVLQNKSRQHVCRTPVGTARVRNLKVHKREKFFVSDFEFFTILYLVKLKY